MARRLSVPITVCSTGAGVISCLFVGLYEERISHMTTLIRALSMSATVKLNSICGERMREVLLLHKGIYEVGIASVRRPFTGVLR